MHILLKLSQRKMIQKTLGEKKTKYHSEFYNKSNKEEQWIRISDGCYRDCDFCYCPKDKLHYKIPEIVRNKVKIMDMNFLYAYPNLRETIEKLGSKRVNNKVVYYEFIAGLDWRLLNLEIAQLLKNNRFKNIRIAWDNEFIEQKQIKKSIELLKFVGYSYSDISVFIICNWKISFEDCCKKLDLLKIWRVKVNDCWFDNQTSPNIEPVHWHPIEIQEFRRRCRKHNQMVLFGIDPEIKD